MSIGFFRNIRITVLATWMSGILFTAALGIAVSGFFLKQQAEVEELIWHKYESGPAEKSHILNNLHLAVGYGGMIHQFKNYVLRRDDRKAAVESRLRDFKAAVTAYRELGVNKTEETALATIEAVIGEYERKLPIIEQMIAEEADQRAFDAAVAVNDAPALEGFHALEQELKKARQASSGEMYRISSTMSRQLELGALIKSLVLGLLVIGLIWFSRARVARPLSVLKQCMVDLAAGNLDTEIPGHEKHDEIGEMARAMHVFKEDAKKIQIMQREKEEADRRAEERGRAEQARAEQDKQKALDELGRRFENSFSKVVHDFSDASGNMHRTANSMVSIADRANVRSRSVAKITEDVNRMMEQIAAATEELSASVSEIETHVSDSAKVTQAAYDKPHRAQKSMDLLAGSANEIGDVVGMIRAVADQTNLLALNANIEAAGAGEAGRGFAVVAEEVKTLASQTGKATETIGRRIKEMQAVAKEAVEVITAIADSMSEVNEHSATISSGIEQQSQAIREIAQNTQRVVGQAIEVRDGINQVNQTLEETGEASGALRTTADGIANQTGALQNAVNHFLREVRGGAA